MPKQGVDRRFAGGTRADHVTDKSNRQAGAGFQLGNFLRAVREQRSAHAVCVQRNVGAGKGEGGRRKVVGVDLAVHLIDNRLDRLCDFRLRGEPFAIRPRFDNLLCNSISAVGQRLNIFKAVDCKNHFFKRGTGGDSQRALFINQTNESIEVVAAHHRAEQFHGTLRADQRRGRFAVRNVK